MFGTPPPPAVWVACFLAWEGGGNLSLHKIPSEIESWNVTRASVNLVVPKFNLGWTTPLRLSVMKMMKAHFVTCNAPSKRQNVDGLEIMQWWDSTWYQRKTNSIPRSPSPPPVKNENPFRYFSPCMHQHPALIKLMIKIKHWNGLCDYSLCL